MRAYAKATRTMLDTNAAYRQFIADFIGDEIQNPNAPELLNKSRALYQHSLRFDIMSDARLQEFRRPSKWLEVFSETSDPASEAHLRFLENSWRNVSSNVPSRYLGLLSVLQLLQPNEPKTFQVLDIGCSQNLGLKKVVLSGLTEQGFSGFEPVSVVEPVGPQGREYYRKAGPASRRFNERNRRFLSVSGVGVDVLPVNDREQQAWTRSCSFYPEELLRPKGGHRRDEWMLLEIANLQRVRFYQCDAAELAPERLQEQFKVDVFDVAFACTALHQVNKAKAQQIRDNLQACAHTVVEQDFIRVEDGQVVFEESWHEEPFLYRTVVSDRGRRPQEVFRWNNGRCELVMKGDGFEEVFGARAWQAT